jgi:TonB family protein
MVSLPSRYVLALLLAAACAACSTPSTQNKASMERTPQAAQAPAAEFSTCTPPSYPRGAAARGEQGLTTVGVLVRADGTARRTEVLGSSGSAALDGAAREAFSSCRFRPAMVGGQPVERWTTIQYIWELTSNREPPPPSLVQLLGKAAEAGQADAQYALYIVLGAVNMPQAPEKRAALEGLLRHSANGGYCLAKFQLGALYQRGILFATDQAQARAWYQQAADCGNPIALQELEEMAAAP